MVAVMLAAGGAGAYWVSVHHGDFLEGESEEEEALERERKPGPDSPDQAMEWVLLAHRDENGNIPRDGLMRARAQAQAMRIVAAQNEQVVEASGGIASTAGITRGGWTWVGPGNIGGRVRAIAIHPLATNVILAGSVSGGIWKTTDSGASWRVIDDFMANLSVSTLVFRPGDPSMMFAATGEGFFNQDAIRGAGIFVSTNEGESWAQLPSTANTSFDFVNRIAFSADGSTLVAATRTGLFRSGDLGGTWTQALGQSDMFDVKFLPFSSTQAVASGRNKIAFFSSNGGVSWTASSGFSTPVSAERIELGVSRSSPNVVYASLDESNGQIWRSSDSGVSFTRVSTPGHLSSQGWYDNAIWVDPTNVDHIVVGGVSLSRSTNGGLSFSSVSSCHADQHAIVNDPNYNGSSNRRVYFGSDGGVCKLEDVTVNTVTSLRNGLGITQFYGGGGNANAGRVLGGTQDNGTLTYNLSTGTSVWTTEFGSDGGFAAVDPVDSNIMYGEIQNFRLHRTLTGASPQYIYGGTGGQSCSKPVPYQITDSCNGTANFIAPFILDPNNRDRLLAGGRSLWKTNDARTPNTVTTGPQWAAIKDPTGGGSNISAIAVAQGNSDIVWVGHNNGDVYVTLSSTAGTPAWNRVDTSAPGLPNRAVTSIVVDPVDPSIAYISLGGFSPDNVWRTTNSGATWQDITGSGGSGLPDVPVRSIALHPSSQGWIYVATDVGVFATENGGATWSLPHEGPSNVAVFQLFWMDSLLVAVTHGRGFYTVAAATTLPSFVKRPLSQGIIPGQTVTFNVLATGVGSISYQWYRGTTGDTSNPIPGATSTSLTTPAITQTTTYWVRAANGLGTADSNTATLTPMPWGALIPGSTTQNPQATSTGLTAPTGVSKTSSMMPLTATTGTTSSTGTSSASAQGGGLWSVPVAMVGAGPSAAASAPAAPAASGSSRSNASPVASPPQTSGSFAYTAILPFASSASSGGAATAGPVAGEAALTTRLSVTATAATRPADTVAPAVESADTATPSAARAELPTSSPAAPAVASTPARQPGVLMPSSGSTGEHAPALAPVAVSEPATSPDAVPAHSRALQMALLAAALVLPAVLARLLIRKP
jgi:hypothetical protein